MAQGSPLYEACQCFKVHCSPELGFASSTQNLIILPTSSSIVCAVDSVKSLAAKFRPRKSVHPFTVRYGPQLSLMPHSVTILRAISDALDISFPEPAVTSLNLSPARWPRKVSGSVASMFECMCSPLPAVAWLFQEPTLGIIVTCV